MTKRYRLLELLKVYSLTAINRLRAAGLTRPHLNNRS